MPMQRFALGLVLGACVVVGASGAVTAQAPQAQSSRTLDVSFNNGLVTIVGANVTIREILVEWGRKGGSRIVNAEKLAGQVLPYIEFRDEPEIVVLRSLLREVPGYGAAPRIAPSPDASTIDTVYLLATRSVPVSNAPVSSSAQPQVQQVQQPPVQNFAPEGFQPPPQPQPRVIPGSPDAEIPPVRPVPGELPPTTPGASAQPTDPSLRTGPGGTVTSTIPGVIIPGTTQTGPPGSGGTSGPPGRGGRGGGGGGR